MIEVMKYLSFLVFALVAVFGVLFTSQLTRKADASVVTGSEYYATTTAASAVYGSTISASRAIKNGYGSIGSVVITGAAAGVINIYDATTTDVSKRTGNTATSSILLVSLPASLAAGTYTFDLTFNSGLYVDLIVGTMPTSTITYR